MDDGCRWRLQRFRDCRGSLCLCPKPDGGDCFAG